MMKWLLILNACFVSLLATAEQADQSKSMYDHLGIAGISRVIIENYDVQKKSYSYSNITAKEELIAIEKTLKNLSARGRIYRSFRMETIQKVILVQDDMSTASFNVYNRHMVEAVDPSDGSFGIGEHTDKQNLIRALGLSQKPIQWGVTDTVIEDGKTGLVRRVHKPFTDFKQDYQKAIRELVQINGPQDLTAKSGNNVDDLQYLNRIGELGGLVIYEYVNPGRNHRSILTNDLGEGYRILYIDTDYSGLGQRTSTTIEHIDGHEVLSIRQRVPGTGNYYRKYYYSFRKDGTFVRLETSFIEELVNQIVSPEYETRKGGGLRLKELRYVSPLWKKEDSNSSPTGGKISLTLRIYDGEVLVGPVHKELR